MYRSTHSSGFALGIHMLGSWLYIRWNSTIYRIASNLTDISNYPDTISNYFLPLITPDSQWSLNFCCSNYPDIVVLMRTARVVLLEQNLQWTAASLVVLKEASCSLSHHEQGAPGTVSFSRFLQLLDRTSIWPNAHAWKRVLIHRTLRTPTIFVCSNYSGHWPK